MTFSAMIQNIPCTLVTGFLGAGKTTVINQLLATKPNHERWALLINEFGRIGIDGALLTSSKNSNEAQTNLADTNLADNGIAIREVSGGCICCTSQLPLQIAISRLLTEHRPQRLIIEPTGLAHPHELLRQLSAPHWQKALSMQAVITVLSAAQWQQQKYRSHEGFQAHVRAADVVVINRYEPLSKTCQQELQAWIATLNPQAQIIWATTAAQTTNTSSEFITPFNTYLAELTAQLSKPSHIISQQAGKNIGQSRISLTLPNHLRVSVPTATDNESKIANNELPYRYHDEQQGMLLAGWLLPPNWIFDADKLQQWLLQLPNWQRIKGVVHTSDGWLQLNFTPDSLTINDASAQIDSRLEIILLSKNDTDSQEIVNGKERQQENQANWAAWDYELMALLLSEKL